MRRRIWFAAYMMDKWVIGTMQNCKWFHIWADIGNSQVAADLGRPAVIMDMDFDIECPTPYEIDSRHRISSRDPSFRAFMPEIILEAERDIEEKKPVYNCFVNMVDLSQILSNVLIGLHSPKSRYIWPSNFALVDELDAQLDSWKVNLPPELQYDMINTDISMPFAALINICYSTVVLLLHRPFMNLKKSENMHVALRSLNTCTVVANTIIDHVEGMESSGYMPLPWMFVTL